MASAPAHRPRRLQALIGPLFIAHALAYPLAFTAAIASMPLAMLLRKQALLAAGNEGASSAFVRDVARDLMLTRVEAAQLEVVLELVLALSAAVFVLAHLAALPWLVRAVRSATDPAHADLTRPRRFYFGALAVTAGVLVVGGAAGWAFVLWR